MFKRTLFTLTLQYSLLLLLIFTLFSGGIYEYMDHTFGDDYRQNTLYEQQGSRAEGAAEAADAGLDRLKYTLIGSYVLLIVILPGVSYILARRAMKPVQKSFEEQQRFVDDASHELRTPLSVLQGELELVLNKERQPADYQRAITASLQEVERLNTLVSGLLMIARGSHAELLASSEPLELEPILQASVERCQASYADKHLTFAIDGSSSSMQGVRPLVEQAVYNLMDNAAKFSKPDGHVDVTLSNSGQYISITIADNGDGMTSEQITHAFDRFWRADSSRAIKGFGLGLPLVQQIALLHKGSVELQHNKAGGITAVLLLSMQ